MTKTPSNLQDPKSGGIRQGEDGRGRSGCGVGLGLETRIESASDGRRHISLAVKRAGEPSAGNRHARFDVAGAGNQLTARIVRHSQRKRRVTARPSLRSKRRQSPTLQTEPTEQWRQSSTLPRCRWTGPASLCSRAADLLPAIRPVWTFDDRQNSAAAARVARRKTGIRS
jgi:hypothetical protein